MTIFCNKYCDDNQDDDDNDDSVEKDLFPCSCSLVVDHQRCTLSCSLTRTTETSVCVHLFRLVMMIMMMMINDDDEMQVTMVITLTDSSNHLSLHW